MMTGPPTQAALLVSACITLCKSQPEKSEATRDDEADPARPHRYRPVPDHDWQQHPSILAVKCNTARLGVITSQPVLGGLHHQYCRPVARSTMRFAHWFRSRGRFGCFSGMA